MLSLRHFPRRKPLLLLVALAVLFLVIRHMRGTDINWDEVGMDEPGRVKRDPELRKDKWVIVTTIHPPTSAMQKLSRLDGWKVLVVADRKTPRNYNLPGATVLDIASQKALGYEIYQYLPFDSYTRKILGYLYAIEHGAKFIYDTDDDNYVEGELNQFKLTLTKSEMLVLQTKAPAVNHYRHFGQSSMWPRGYPLDSVGDETSRRYTLCQVHTPAIQQGLVDGDPDVDAMFRLTRKHHSEHLDVKFDRGAPPMLLPKGTFSPTNSQNTLYTMKAFWSLVMPVSVSDRVSDIYRSYWAQRLLWEIGENTGYFPPTGVHHRNPHSYLLDAVDENDLYRYTGQLLKYLSKWTCSKTMFFDCVIDLTHQLAQEGFLKRRDADLVGAWLSDLSTVGYPPPVMRSGSGCFSTNHAMDVTFYPDEQNLTLPHSSIKIPPADLLNHGEIESFMVGMCGASHVHHWHMTRRTASIVPSTLLVNTIHSVPEAEIPVLELIYQPSFPHRIYCGPKISDSAFLDKWKVTYITPPSNIHSSISCLLEVTRLHYNVDAYLHLTHNMLLHVGDSILHKQPNMMWVTGEYDAFKPEIASLCNENKISCVTVTKNLIGQLNRQVNDMEIASQPKSKIKECFAKLGSDPNFQVQKELLWVREMAFRLPAKSVTTFGELANHFLKDSSKQKYDFFSLLLMECMENVVEYLSYGNYMDSNLDEAKLDFFFPYQLSHVQNKGETIHTHFCSLFEDYLEK